MTQARVRTKYFKSHKSGEDLAGSIEVWEDQEGVEVVSIHYATSPHNNFDVFHHALVRYKNRLQKSESFISKLHMKD
jgi:hypothetical protein